MKWVRVAVVGAVFLAAGLLGATVAIGAGGVVDNFTGIDGDPWNPAIWTDDDLANGDSTIQGNEGQLEVSGIDSDTGIARQLADGVPHSDFEAVYKQRFGGGVDEDKRFGFEFRRSSAWSTVNPDAPETGYQLHNQQGIDRVVLYRFDSDGTFEALHETGDIDRTVTNWFRVRAVGDTIRVRWWADGTSEPSTWNFEITEGTYLTGEAFSFTHWRGAGSGTRQAIIDDLDITVTNSPPVADNDSYTVDEDTVLNVDPPGLLDNDSDADGDSLSAVLGDGPAHGTVDLDADGSFTYTPDADFSGSDSFTYVANDGSVDSNEATVTITVNEVNDAPVANDDSYTVDEDTPVSVDVAANDTDSDDGLDLTSVSITTLPTKGTAVSNGDGTVTYTPDADFAGTDTFEYTIDDNTGATSNTATVTITVNEVNDAPVANDDSYTVDEDTVLNVAAPGVLGDDTDADGDPLSAVLANGPSNGSVTLNADGSFTYTPDADFSGSDSFTYKANDGAADSNVATVDITVNPVSDPSFVDIDDSIFEQDILWLAEVGITKGCNPPTNDEFCPNDNVTRGQMAAFFVRALGLSDRLDDPFVDDDGNTFEVDIEKLAAAGITKGCNPPTNDEFCPNDPVTRGQMAAFFHRAADLLGLPD